MWQRECEHKTLRGETRKKQQFLYKTIQQDNLCLCPVKINRSSTRFVTTDTECKNIIKFLAINQISEEAHSYENQHG